MHDNHSFAYIGFCWKICLGLFLFSAALAVAHLAGGRPAWAEDVTPASMPAPSPTCMADVPSDLAPHWERICTGEARNAVLDYMHGGLAAMATGHLDLAERAFDRSLAGIETVYADNEEAAKARSVWHAEAVKDFKGEPYERVMAYYYRGLLYLARGDWDNAQAAFQGGVLQDTFAEEARYRADVGSLVWLQAWANRCRGNVARAKELFAEAQAINFKLVEPMPDQTLLVVAETGQGPVKFAAGRGGQKLGVREGLLGNQAVAARLGGQTVPLAVAEDTFFQAVTRGGRAADTVIAEKLEAKDGVEALGQAAMVAGVATMAYSRHSSDNNRQNNNAAAFGAAVALVGLLAYAAAQGMQTEVDTRTWANLPHTVHIAASAPPKDLSREFDLVDPAGRSVLVSREAVVHANPGTCALAWVGAHNIAPSLTVEAAPGEAGGNCRTATGALVLMEPSKCMRIGGQALGSGGAQSCRTPDGGSTMLSADTCRRIGGQPG
ncbi:MAG TPA: hypothetical protein VL974_01220 [Magnetospirillum sp.]|jgi:hypothetical protein|nr:hypothetical protein [Magnetospirillum sp.]